ncbi:COPII coat assembly protein sec16 [Aspergillus ambiguus]|uniref:COPII coat assembly protein SEC16 n=1 Tax=Aspergillus ambiguus TaxID=176160 RepID=UPI003CCDA4B2
MALPDQSASWNPALRSEDESSAPMKSGDLSTTTTTDVKQSTIENVLDVPQPTSTPEQDRSDSNNESLHQGASCDVTETVVPSLSVDTRPNMIAQDQIPRQLEGSPPEIPPAAVDTLEDTPKHQGSLETVSGPTDEGNVFSHESKDSAFPPTQDAPDLSWAEDSHSQTAEEQDASAWTPHHQSKETPISTNGDFPATSHDLWGSPTSADGEHDFFNQVKTQTKPIYMPPESESRYEEGVPLLDDDVSSPIEPAANQESRIDQLFDGDEDEEGAFFNEVQKSPPAGRSRPSLHMTRKSTSQVLGSLDATLKSPASDASPTVQEFDSILAAAASGTQLDKSPSDEELAARWQAELSDEEPEQGPEEDLAARWQAELDDDDDMLLEDEAGDDSGTQDVNGAVPQAGPPALSSPFGTPESAVRPKPQPTSYTPHQPSTSDLLQGIHSQAFPSANTVTAPNYFAPQPPKPAANRAESFAERSKEGYKSPYDLPEDLARPRRPAATVRPMMVPGNNVPRPPSTGGAPPPPPKGPSMPTPPMGTVPSAPVPPPKNFYEELPPPPPKPQSRPSSSGRYTPAQSGTVPVTAQPVPPPPANPYAAVPPPPAVDAPGPAPSQFQQPEKMDPYANFLAPAPPSASNAPSAASRYSPKPPSLQGGVKPPQSPRYSPAPPPSTAPPPRNRYASQPLSGPGQATVLPFQPRTSSPLAYHEKVSYQPQGDLRKPSFAEQEPTSGPQIEIQQQPDEPHIGLPVGDAAAVDIQTGGDVPGAPQQTSPPRNPYAPPAYVDEFSKRVVPMSSVPPISTSAPAESQFMPPRRSHTQSPSQQMLGPRLSVPSVDPLQRPASVHGSGSPTKSNSPYAPPQASVHNRVASQQLEFIPPTDGQEMDPLQRWRGAPIVNFGFGGTFVSCFPKHIPRYTAGQAGPKIMAAPGEAKLHQLRDWIPTTDSIVQHPGPLKGKSKKKDLLAWLSSKIAQFENEGISEAAQLHPDSAMRHDEKVLLWKIIRILVEHDGSLEGLENIQKALRGVIFPHLQDVKDSDQTYGSSATTFSTFKSFDAPSQSDAVDSQAVSNLRNCLLLGDREKAVWVAVDNRLWGHAMIIASTLDKSVWKQVVQEFVRREVRSASGNTESLAALYEIFAGNVEESIDELVPPSARAGLQMISKVDGHGPTKNALDGLNSWRDTLGLVLGNRTPEDHQALLSLGRLLLSYGRVEAAHICFIFSRATVFGGADDPQSGIVLLGADHQHLSSAVLQDEDAFLLTEAYEYATTILAGTPTATLPHLLAFKLLHAWSLAERGSTAEAQHYCDAIAASLKSTTKPSGYYNPHLLFGVDELSARLRQTANDGGSSWISKPSMEKVSGSMWAKFNSFVAGDDSDAASTGSGKAGEGDVGPFARFTGTPTVSRSPSVTDLYGPYAASAAQPISGSAPSRYQPSSQYAPNSSPEQPRGRSSMDSQRSSSYGVPFPQRRGSQEPAAPMESPFYQGGAPYGSPSAVGYQSTPPQTSYMPLAPVEENSATQSYPAASMGSPMSSSPYLPSSGPSFYQQFNQESMMDSQTGGSSYMPPTTESSYMPPSSNIGYEPPSIETTAAPDDDATSEPSDNDRLKKKKSFMDDDEDDDLAARAASLQKAEKERKDREADENFRKIAEAEAKKAPQPKKSSWWPGWFGGGKKEDNNNSGGPIRAKLGEENSFYYDKELKKWVNKKDPNSATVSRGTPPPPRAAGPPSRTASGSSAPPPAVSPKPPGADSRPTSSAGAPPSQSGSPAPSSLGVPPPFLNSVPRSVSTGAAVPTPPGSSSGPPPRPATSLSTASSIDDLLGAPQVRKGGTAKSKKKGRYVDVMAK